MVRLGMGDLDGCIAMTVGPTLRGRKYLYPTRAEPLSVLQVRADRRCLYPRIDGRRVDGVAHYVGDWPSWSPADWRHFGLPRLFVVRRHQLNDRHDHLQVSLPLMPKVRA